MKTVVRLFLIMVISFGVVSTSLAQDGESILIEKMLQLESNILEAYLEYRKLYYEDKSRLKELSAFENLVTIYINQVNEIYETLTLVQSKTETARDIFARSLIFKALMFLEKASLNIEYYEYASYEYYKALELYNKTDDPPVIYKDLPRVIPTGDKNYYRLVDLLEDKGSRLNEFGKINIVFRNFKVTANFNPQMLEIVKLPDPKYPEQGYTYHLALPKIIAVFEEVFRNTQEVETYVALPKGTYVLRLNQSNESESDYMALTTLYVRNDQEQFYCMEPLGDWMIFYENPKSKKPDYYKFRRTNQLNTISEIKEARALTNKSKSSDQSDELSGMHIELINEIVAHYLPQFDIKLSSVSNHSEITDQRIFISIISRSVIKYVESPSYYNQSNLWMASWQISKEVRELVNPASPIGLELLELIYRTLNEI